MKSKTIFKLRSIFLSPNSKLELWLRTQYHRINKTRLFFKINHWLAKRSYKQWIARQNRESIQDKKVPDHGSGVSFLMECPEDNNEDILKTLKSLQAINGFNWEVIIFTNQPDGKLQLPAEIMADERLEILNSNQDFSLEDITTPFTLFCQAGDQFFSNILFHFYNTFSEVNTAAWYYYDCEILDNKQGEATPLFKPQTLSLSLLLSLNYLSRGFIRTSFLQENLSTKDLDKNLLADEYELALLLCEKNNSAAHIPQVLVRQTSLVKPDNTKIQAKVIAHLSRSGLGEPSTQPEPIGTRFTWQTSEPSVAIIIPTKNNQKLLSNCLNSLINKTSYKNFTIHIIDNNSDNPEILNYYQKLQSKSLIEIHPYQKTFNYSQANNLGAAQSDSDLLLFLNDDMEVYDKNWLEELVQWAIRPEIGIVGAKLIRSNHIIQHAGIILGLNGFAGHIYLNAPEHYSGLFGSVDWYRDYLAVTGACQMIRRQVFVEVDGFDEGYKLAFGDIDLCLRVHESGYRNIYTPFASLYHYEGQSRGYSTPRQDIVRSYEKMKSALSSDDPYFSTNLTYTRIPKCKINEESKKDREDQFRERKKFFSK